jgi:hypothetical protein
MTVLGVLAILFVASIPGPHYHIVFVNDSDESVVLDVAMSDHSGRWRARMPSRSLTIIRPRPDRDSHLEIQTTVAGQTVQTSPGYFSRSGHDVECYRIRRGQQLARCDERP